MEFQLQTGMDLVRTGVETYKPAGGRVREGLGEGPRATWKHLKKNKGTHYSATCHVLILTVLPF